MPELERLRGRRLVALRGIKLSAAGGAEAKGQMVPGISGRYLDVVVTFHGLARALLAEEEEGTMALLNLSVNVYAQKNPGSSFSLSWRPSAPAAPTAPTAAFEAAGWVDGWVSDSESAPSLIGTPPGGPLSLRRGQDSLSVRVLKDASVCEAFWDGGRARQTARWFYASAESAGGLWLSAGGASGITADVEVWEMGSAWIE